MICDGSIVRMLTLAAVLGQASLFPTAQAAPAKGSISGMVLDADTGAPIAGLAVYVNRGSPGGAMAMTDSQGHYAFRDLEPGTCVIRVSDDRFGRGPSGVRIVRLGEGQELTSIEFRLQAFGEISGKVLDQDNEPVPDMGVFLVSAEYTIVGIRYFCAGLPVTTNDKGEYTLKLVEPGRPFLILAKKRGAAIPAVSDVAASLTLRKRVLEPAYYPNSTSIEGAQAVVLRGGEYQEGVDIRMSLSPSYCMGGVLEAAGRAAALRFALAEQDVSNGGGVFVVTSHGTSGPDGKIRICGLHSGRYDLVAWRESTDGSGSPDFFGYQAVTITDRDALGVRVMSVTSIPLRGEIVLNGQAPKEPLQATLNVSLEPTPRSVLIGNSLQGRSPLPGEFFFPRVLVDDSVVRILGLPASLYVKEISYGGVSILREPLRVGSAVGDARLRVTVADDGGFLRTNVVDKKGDVVFGANVVIMPKEAGSESELAAMRISGQTNQEGVYSSIALAPGPYNVLATSSAVTDLTPETINKLWNARSKAKEVKIGPSTTVELRMELVTLN
jgi:hypothetical protein